MRSLLLGAHEKFVDWLSRVASRPSGAEGIDQHAHGWPQIDGLTPCRWAREGGPLQAPGLCTQQHLRLSLDKCASNFKLVVAAGIVSQRNAPCVPAARVVIRHSYAPCVPSVPQLFCKAFSPCSFC